MKVYQRENVLEATQARIRALFDDFDRVLVAFSGGKDSTVTLELAIEEARRRNRLPVTAVFIDQEIEWTETVRYMEYIADRPEVDLWWVQIPIMMENASSFVEGTFWTWDPDNEDLWVHPKNPKAITEDIFRAKPPKTFDFYKLFDLIYTKAAGQDRFAVLYGMRAEESQTRLVSLTTQPRYKNYTWSSHAGKPHREGYKFAVIYDWKPDDTWKAIADHGWGYNRSYDLQFRYGVSPYQMRVSALVHGVAAGHELLMVQELDPDLYERMAMRLPGVDTTSKLQKGMRIHNLPAAFSTWKEYCDHLMATLLPEKNRVEFERMLNRKDVQRIAEGESFWREFAGMIQANDYYGTKMTNFLANLGVKEYEKDRKYAKK